MLASTCLLLTFAATAFSQAQPAGTRKVYITSNVDAKYVVVAKTPVKSGTTTVVQTLSSKIEQQWYIQAGNSSIQLANTTLCMDAGAKSML